MPSYYFDIETTGLDPRSDRIITIQYQKLDIETGKPIGELVILKEWETSEKDIIKRFILDTGILEENPFSFVPIGYNLRFEHNFIKARAKTHELIEIDILDKPFIDLRAIGILMNKGMFKGSGLDKFTGKKNTGGNIPLWYANQEYSKIIEYIVDEAQEFIKFNSWLYKELPKLYGKFMEEILEEY